MEAEERDRAGNTLVCEGRGGEMGVCVCRGDGSVCVRVCVCVCVGCV